MRLSSAFSWDGRRDGRSGGPRKLRLGGFYAKGEFFGGDLFWAQ
jgi:hypothetical protein